MTSEQQTISRLRASPSWRGRSGPRERRSAMGPALAPGRLRLPGDVLLIGAAAAGFALVTLVLSLASGAPFVLPTERVSPALGLHAAVPLGVAALGYLACRALAQRWRTPPQAPDVLWRQILTDLFFLALFVVVAYFHFHIKMWMPVLNPHLHDELYFALDERARWLMDAAAALRNSVASLLPAADLWYQGAQLSLFILSFWVHALGDRRWHRHNMTAILLNLMIGPLAYLVAPAVGPFVFEQGPNVAASAAQQEMYRLFLELQAQGPSWLAAHGGAYFTAPLAAMPSLHVSLACIVSYYALRARLAITPLVLFLAGWIVIESVVARWHYLVDVPAGILLAVVVIALANRLCRGRHGAGAADAGNAVPAAANPGGAGRPALPARPDDGRAMRPTRPQSWPPKVWILTCHREGDNAQMIGLAEALGWPFEVKRIVHRKLELLPNLLFPATLLGVDQRRSSPLAPPWPDLIIFAFRANENIVRWVRAQAGGRPRSCLVGRPWSPLKEFDLIVTTPQLGLPARTNVLHNTLPLHRVTPRRLAAAAALWEPRLTHLPRPYIALLVGGSSGPYVFDRRAAARLGGQASAMARRTGGSLLVTTSARTSRAAADALWAAIDCPAYCYRWSRTDEENPYFGFVALADAFIVTGESISMITEGCASDKPVFMFDFGGGPVAMRSHGPTWRPWPWISRLEDLHPQTWIYALYMLLPKGRLNRTRDLRPVHDAILASGRAQWLDGAGAPAPSTAVADDMERAVRRVRALFEAPARGGAPAARRPETAAT